MFKSGVYASIKRQVNKKYQTKETTNDLHDGQYKKIDAHVAVSGSEVKTLSSWLDSGCIISQKKIQALKKIKAKEVELLHIEIVRAPYLKPRQKDVKPSTYCVYKFYKFNDRRTAVVPASNNPEFMEQHTYRLSSTDPDIEEYLKLADLDIYVFDVNQLDTFIGKVTIPLFPLVEKETIKGVFQLFTRYREVSGYIEIAMYWQHDDQRAISGTSTMGSAEQREMPVMTQQNKSSSNDDEMTVARTLQKKTAKKNGFSKQSESSSPASSRDGIYISRHVALSAGVPQSVPCLTVNRLCGSRFQSIITGCQEICLREEVVLADGAENMCQAPYAGSDIRFGTKFGTDYKLEDTLRSPVKDTSNTAENLAVKYKISREISYESLLSQNRWKQAQEKKRSSAEVVPARIKIKGKEAVLDIDEHSRLQTTIEGLAKLNPVFKKGGVVTAGNASVPCITIYISYLSLRKEATVSLDSTVKFLYVEFEFLNERFEAVVTSTLAKKVEPEKMEYNFKKVFYIQPTNLKLKKRLAEMFASDSPGSSSIKFIVVSEPSYDQQDALACKDIGYESVDLRQILKEEKDKINEDILIHDVINPNIIIGALNISMHGLSVLQKFCTPSS